MARDEPGDIEEESSEPAEETSYEMIRTFEKNRKAIALRDLNRVKENTQSIIKVIQVQLTKVLMDVTATGEAIQSEITAFWMKELPIQNMVQNYLAHVNLLINITKQIEDIYRRHYDEVYTTVDFPEYEKIEESYEQQIAQLFQQMQIMKEEVEKLKSDLEDEFDERVKEAALKEKNKLHTEYDQVLTEAELEMDKIKAENKRLFDENATLKATIELAKKNMPSESPVMSTMEKVEAPAKVKDLSHNDGDVYSSPKTPISSKYEVVEPGPLVESKDGFKLALTREQLSDPQIQRLVEKVTPIKDKLGLDANPTKKQEVWNDIFDMVRAGKNYGEIQKQLYNKYSPSTFYKYFQMMIDEKAIVRKGTGSDAQVILYPHKLKEETKDAKE